MRLSLVFAFGAILGVSSAHKNENWGVAQTGHNHPLDAVRPQKPVDDIVEDYHIVHNREQWEILKTKQQRLRTGKVQLQELLKKLQAKSGRAYPDPAIMDAIDRLLKYRPSDPRILGDVNHLPLDKKFPFISGSHSSSSYGSPNYQDGYGVSNQAYGAKPNSPRPDYGTGNGVKDQSYGGYSPQSVTSTGGYHSAQSSFSSTQSPTGQVPMSKVQTGVYSPGEQSSYAQDRYSNKPRPYDSGPRYYEGQGLLSTDEPSLVIY